MVLLEEVARLLVEASAIDVVTDRETTFELWTIGTSGETVRASGPRLEVAEGMKLSARLSVDGVPHVVTLLVEEARVQSQARAAMTLAVVAAHADGQQRQSERHNLAATATLTALVCGRVVPGEQIPGLVTDLSATGAGVKVADARPRPPDLMHLYCRFLEGPIDCDVRIMRSDTDPTGASKLGCLFVDPSPTTVDLVVRVIRRLAGTSRDG